MAPVAVLSMALMFVLAGHPDWLQVWLGRAERWLPARLAGLARPRSRPCSRTGSACCAGRSDSWPASAWSVVLWLIICAETWAVAHAFHIDMPMVGSWLMLALLVVGVAVPTPGAVGGFHEAFRLGATAFFGADNDAAIGAAILLHATSFVPVTLLGLWFAVPRRPQPAWDQAHGGDPRTGRGEGMKCPYCGFLEDQVVDSREIEKASSSGGAGSA